MEYDEEGSVIVREFIDGLREGEWTYQVGDHTEAGCIP